jgi:hypothetical protein
MPFRSRSQQRFMFATHPRMAKRWADETPNMKKLPEKVKQAGIPKGLRAIAESAFDTTGDLSKAQQYAASRNAANIHGRGLGMAARDGSLMSKSYNKRLAKSEIELAKKQVDSSYPTTRASRQLQHGIENRRMSRDLLSKKAEVDKIEGGLADHMKSSDFPKKKLKAGQKVEKEHTKDPSIAKEIAKDHLAEDSDYYKKLKKMEKSAFSKMAGSLKKKMTRKYC